VRGRGGFEEGCFAEVGLGDLHAVHEGGGGGAVHESAGEAVDDAIEVDLDRGAVFGELEFERRVDPGLGDEHGSVVVGLGWDGRAMARVALPGVDTAVVSAEVFAVLRGLGALLVAGEDVSAELDHGVVTPFPWNC
jgi:hypothetical protein